MLMKHYKIRILGRVQGVWFRDFVKKSAKKNSIAGFVQNLPDGTVYIEAEGDVNDISFFIADCRKGPVAAKVIDLKIEETDELNDFKDFVME